MGGSFGSKSGPPGLLGGFLERLSGASWLRKGLSQAMDEGGGRDDTKQGENVRPRTRGGGSDLVPENVYVGNENREKPQLQRVF